MKLTTSWASTTSNDESANGSDSAEPTCTSTPGNAFWHAATNGSDGSTPATAEAPTRDASSPRSAPDPQPTSSAASPAAMPTASQKAEASAGVYRPTWRA